MLNKFTMVAAAMAMAFTVSTASAQETIRFAVDSGYPPFSQKTESGEMVGFDVDIAKAICSVLNTKCIVSSQNFDGIIPGLLVKKFDAIIASMSITEARKKKVDFSNKYYTAVARFVAKEGVDWVADNNGLKGKPIGVQRGTTHHDYLLKRYPDVKIKTYGTQEEVILDLTVGRVDAMVADAVVTSTGFLKSDAGKGYAFFGGDHFDPKIYGEGVGVAVRKSDGKLLSDINKAIKQIRADGTYAKINSKYFEFDIYGD